MNSLINESTNILVKEILKNIYNIYIVVFILVNIYNCIKVMWIISQVSYLIKYQNEINNKIGKLSIIKDDREAFIKTIVLKCIDEHLDEKKYLKVIEKQNKAITILRRIINKINKNIKNNSDN
jgi:hypothetical protein